MILISILSSTLMISLSLIAAMLIFRNRKNINNVIWIFVIHISMSFYYTVFFTFSDMPMKEWVSQMGGNVFQKLALAIVLLTALLCGAMYMRRQKPTIRLYELAFPVLAVVLSLIGYAKNYVAHDGQWLIDAGSALAFLLAIMGLLVLVPRRSRIDVLDFAIVALSVMVFLSVGMGLYEISAGRAWAIYKHADGTVVLRASGLFFNPNLLGAWLGFVFVLFMRQRETRGGWWRAWQLALPALIGVGLYLSGSRGATIALTASAIVAVLADWQSAGKTIGRYLIVGFGFAAVLSVGLVADEKPYNALSQRWFDIPLAVIEHFSSAETQWCAGSAAQDNSGSDLNNLCIALSGRLTGELRDNGFLAALDRGGMLALGGLALIWIAAVAALARNSLHCSPARRANMWAMLVYLFAWTMQARAFQVYPIWLFMAIGLVMAFRDCGDVESGQDPGHSGTAVST